MKSYSVDTVLEVRLRHEPGTLARLATAIAEHGGLLCEIETLRIGDEQTLRAITVETHGVAEVAPMIEAVKNVDGVTVMSTRDRVMDSHRGGKIRICSRLALENVRDLRTIYTPGVAQVVRAIHDDRDVAWTSTWRGRNIAIVTDGSRVLGLGNVGPLASLPVMEGKAVLYDQLADVSAVPLVLDVASVDEFVETVVRVAPGFGAIHLEDIRSPECFEIERRLGERLRKPVFHDDQHGTATAVLAAIMNASKAIDRPLARARVAVLGLGAAGTAIAGLVKRFGVEDVLCHDPDPRSAARAEAAGARVTTFAEVLAADIVIAVTGRARLIDPSQIKRGQIILALSNPDPEIEPRDALAAGAALASDGRAINNALAFPGLMRGALESRSRAINHEMMIEAARLIASRAEPGELVPSPLARELHEAIAAGVVRHARRTGMAGTAAA
jgi:malate dehydrogenase (oxaloacetate-decarboxylating)